MKQIAEAARILRDKRSGITEESAYQTLKHAEEYLWKQTEDQPTPSGKVDAALLSRTEQIAAMFASARLEHVLIVRDRRGLNITVAGVSFYEDYSANRILDFSERGVLVSIPRAPRGGWSYSPLVTLIAIDAKDKTPFARRVRPSCKTVDQAFASITPKAAARARERQGDFFFVPVRKAPVANAQTELKKNAPLADSRHIAEELMERYWTTERTVELAPRIEHVNDWNWTPIREAKAQTCYCNAPDCSGNAIITPRTRTKSIPHHEYFVRGRVVAPDHSDVFFAEWHKAVQAPRVMQKFD